MSGGTDEHGIPPTPEEWNRTGSPSSPESKNAGDPGLQQEEHEEVDYDYYGYAWSYSDEPGTEAPLEEPEGEDGHEAACDKGEEEDEEGEADTTAAAAAAADDDEE